MILLERWEARTSREGALLPQTYNSHSNNAAPAVLAAGKVGRVENPRQCWRYPVTPLTPVEYQ